MFLNQYNTQKLPKKSRYSKFIFILQAMKGGAWLLPWGKTVGEHTAIGQHKDIPLLEKTTGKHLQKPDKCNPGDYYLGIRYANISNFGDIFNYATGWICLFKNV